MAKCKVTLVKKGSGMKAAAKMKVGDPPVTEAQLVDNGDNTVTVNGVSAAGNPVDISAVATITVISSDPSVVTVDTPVGMTFGIHAVKPVGKSDIGITATWNDGSTGPFSFTLPTTVVAGPAGGLTVTLGTPTSH